jgi:uncharacterized protein YfaT (DUF1175 family)
VTRFPADGKSTGRLTYTAAHSGNECLKGPFGKKESVKVVARESDERGEHLFFRSTGVPGKVWFEGADGSKLDLTFYKTVSDIDEDGFPDVSELDTEEDRNAFREWFVRIAESQFLKHNASWNDTERDCAGLIRYSYREALKQHNNTWLLRSGLVVDKNIPDIQKFHYPDVPGIGDKIFKIRSGNAEELESFGSFADALTLSKFNTGFVSRSLTDAKKGDILFFRIEGRGKVQFHSMIVASADKGPIMLIYHTGKQDVIKRVESVYLKGSEVFNPDEKNERFLGVFRFHILE